MGFKDPNDSEWEAEYWDDYLKEFGREAYIATRYEASERATIDEGAEGIEPAEGTN